MGLTGPSRRITYEPVEAPQRQDEPVHEDPTPVEPERIPEHEREKVPA